MKRIVYKKLIFLFSIHIYQPILGEKPALPPSIKFELVSQTKQYTAIGFIKLPQSFKNAPLEKCPVPHVYYGGSVITMTKSYDNDRCPLFSYTCFTETPLTSFDIVVTLAGAPTSNTIKNLVVPDGTPYVHYQLKAQPLGKDQSKYEWDATETRGFGPFDIPSTAVIIAEDADLIKGIQLPPKWQSNGLSLPLPTILYLNIDQELFDFIHNAALLASLDIDGFHKKEEWVILESRKNRIFKPRVS